MMGEEGEGWITDTMISKTVTNELILTENTVLVGETEISVFIKMKKKN